MTMLGGEGRPTPAQIWRRDPETSWWRLLPVPILAAIATFLAPFATGAPVSRAIGIGLTFGVVAWLISKALAVPQRTWPAAPFSEDLSRRGRSWELPGLDSAFQRPQTMAARPLRTLAELAAALLADRGLSLTSPAAIELLGARQHQLLTDPEAKPPSARELSAVINQIAALAAAPDNNNRIDLPTRLRPMPTRRRP